MSCPICEALIESMRGPDWLVKDLDGSEISRLVLVRRLYHAHLQAQHKRILTN